MKVYSLIAFFYIDPETGEGISGRQFVPTEKVEMLEQFAYKSDNLPFVTEIASMIPFTGIGEAFGADGKILAAQPINKIMYADDVANDLSLEI